MCNFLGLTLSEVFSLYFMEEARSYCMKLEGYNSFRSFASIPSPSWYKEHDKHPQLSQRKNFFEPDRRGENIIIAANVKLCVSSVSWVFILRVFRGRALFSPASIFILVLTLSHRWSWLSFCCHELLLKALITKCWRNGGRQNSYFTTTIVINKWFRQEWSVDANISEWKLLGNNVALWTSYL